MGSLYKQAPMAKYPWIFCHLSLDILPFILASMPVEAWHPCKSIIGMRAFPFYLYGFFCITDGFLSRQNSMVHHFRKNTEQFLP